MPEARPRLPVLTVTYAVLLLASNITLELASARTERRVLQSMSTNLAHLTRDPWLVLPASALFTRGGLPFALAGCLICVGLLEVQAGPAVAFAVGAAGHVFGTLISEGVIAIRVATGDLPSAARQALDVGPSYILVACACAVIAWPRAHRAARIACLIAVAPLFVFTAWRLPEGRIDAMGHVSAAAVGIIAGVLLRSRPPRTLWPVQPA